MRDSIEILAQIVKECYNDVLERDRTKDFLTLIVFQGMLNTEILIEIRNAVYRSQMDSLWKNIMEDDNEDQEVE